MKTKLLICLAFSFNLSIIAKPINQEDARTNVVNFFKSKAFKRSKIKGKNRQDLNLVFKGRSELMGYPLYYVFNFTDNSGYVIASGDDSITEVLGYSDEGAFDINNITSDMRWWLSEYERDIKYAIKNGKNAGNTRSTYISGSDDEDDDGEDEDSEKSEDSDEAEDADDPEEAEEPEDSEKPENEDKKDESEDDKNEKSGDDEE